MAKSFSLSSEIHVFPCPNCQETINTSMQQCSFCGTPIDRAAAEAAAAETSRISQACSDASYQHGSSGSASPTYFLAARP